jgi:hypothetical protein
MCECASDDGNMSPVYVKNRWAKFNFVHGAYRQWIPSNRDAVNRFPSLTSMSTISHGTTDD